MKRTKINRCLRRTAVLAVSAAVAMMLPTALSGCKKPDLETSAAVEETVTEKPGEPITLREATVTASGEAARMIESGGFLFFKYQNTIYQLEEKTGERKALRTFEEGEENQSFWVYAGGLYYDSNQPGKEESARLYGLYRLDLESKETDHLADLTAQPSALYLSGDCLYVKGFNVNIAYRLDEQGRTAGELAPTETIYGMLPEGCVELYQGMLPYYVDHCGYMPVQNDTCLVIAEADGGNARELPEITNTSSVLFAEGCFFALFRDGNGNTACYRYDADTLTKTLIFEGEQNPQLLQEKDGFLYYMVNQASESVGGNAAYYRVSEQGGAPELVMERTGEPGMTGSCSYNGSFFAAADGLYGQQISSYGVYLGRIAYGIGEELTLLTPALWQSPISDLGEVKAEQKTISCACGEKTAAQIYVEQMVFTGDGEALARMNETLEKRSRELMAYGESMITPEEEALIHKEDFRPYSMTVTVQGITYLNEDYLSLEMDGYEDSGTAHGMPSREYFIFDRRSGEQLNLSDLVENSPEELQALVGAAFRRLAEETNFSFESPEDLEHTVADDVSYQSKFYLSSEGLVFYYDPYVIAPFSEGFPQVVIPYGDLKLKNEKLR